MMKHMQWLSDSGERLSAIDGAEIQLWNLAPQDDPDVLSEWAAHFRSHYCLDFEIDELRSGYGLSREEYLVQLVFPDEKAAPGPSVRSGDFAEILVADYLQFHLGYWVPRWRYDDKPVRNESTKGADIVAFHVAGAAESPEDELAVYEAKATLTNRAGGNRLADALAGSAADFNIRKAESLNAIRRRLLHADKTADAELVKRFQNKSRRPYKDVSGAAAVLSAGAFSREQIETTDCSAHPNRGDLRLLVITGPNLMTLCHALYARAAADA